MAKARDQFKLNELNSLLCGHWFVHPLRQGAYGNKIVLETRCLQYTLDKNVSFCTADSHQQRLNDQMAVINIFYKLKLNKINCWTE